jgi:hypothetical protein
MEAEPVGNREQGSAEALHLKATGRLGAKALREAVRREREKRDDDCGYGRRKRTRRTQYDFPPGRQPEEDQRRRKQDDGLDLRREGNAE